MLDQLELIVQHAVMLRASDIHLLPYSDGGNVLFRIDGIMSPSPDANLTAQVSANFRYVVARAKILAQLDLTQQSKAQDGAFSIKELNTQIRVSIVPFLNGEGVVMRLLKAQNEMIKLSDLGLSDQQFDTMTATLQQTSGLIITCGPTGSGKTTTLYAMLQELSQKRIITVEDPVEYRCEWLSQVCLRHNPAMNFSSSLRSFLRHDPEVIMVGEVRDQETAQISGTAALTGHLVITSLHTESALSTIHRLINMGLLTWLVRSVILLIISQRQISLLCHECKFSIPANDPRYILFQQSVASDSTVDKLFRVNPKGCENCNFRGRTGRKVFFEMLKISDIVWCPINVVDPLKTKLVGHNIRDSICEQIRQGNLDVAELYSI